jgi:hypothetical protein
MSKTERTIDTILFYALLVLHVLPVLLNQYFLTVDGPAHLYNARIIYQMFTQADSVYNVFYSLQSFLFLPNSIGHLLMIGLQFVFPALLAEKIILILYLIILPLSFRFFIKQVSVQNIWLSIFIFPFVYSFLFIYGFYNFLFGLILMLFASGYFVRFFQKVKKRRYSYILGIFALLMFYAHIFVLMLFFLMILLWMLKEMYDMLKNKTWDKETMNSIFFLCFSLLPSCILSVIFIMQGTTSGIEYSYVSITDRWSWIIGVQPAKALSYGKEAIYTRWISISFVLLLINAFVIMFQKKYHRNVNQTIGLLIFPVIVLLLYFILPDGNDTSGFISSRLLLVFFLYLIVCIAVWRIHVIVKYITLFFIIYASVAMLGVYQKNITEYQTYCQSVIEASELIEPDATVVSVMNNDLFIFKHLHSYIALNKPMLLLQNYEADLNYFPLKWNIQNMKDYRLGSLSAIDTCILWTHNPNNEKELIQYVMYLSDRQDGEPQDCIRDLLYELNISYRKIYENYRTGLTVFKTNE